MYVSESFRHNNPYINGLYNAYQAPSVFNEKKADLQKLEDFCHECKTACEKNPEQDSTGHLLGAINNISQYSLGSTDLSVMMFGAALISSLVIHYTNDSNRKIIADNLKPYIQKIVTFSTLPRNNKKRIDPTDLHNKAIGVESLQDMNSVLNNENLKKPLSKNHTSLMQYVESINIGPERYRRVPIDMINNLSKTNLLPHVKYNLSPEIITPVQKTEEPQKVTARVRIQPKMVLVHSFKNEATTQTRSKKKVDSDQPIAKVIPTIYHLVKDDLNDDLQTLNGFKEIRGFKNLQESYVDTLHQCIKSMGKVEQFPPAIFIKAAETIADKVALAKNKKVSQFGLVCINQLKENLYINGDAEQILDPKVMTAFAEANDKITISLQEPVVEKPRRGMKLTG